MTDTVMTTDLQLRFYRRLRKVCSRFGSSNDAEVLAAARKAQALIEQEGLTWKEVISGNGQHDEGEPVDENDLMSVVKFCLSRADVLNNKEEKFVRNLFSLLDRGYDLTEKQEDWLFSIYRSLKL